MSYELGDPDDRCCDEGREADIKARDADDCSKAYGVPHDPYAHRTPEEDAEWEADKRLDYEADRICGHHWSNC
jgi:hypothetical protein